MTDYAGNWATQPLSSAVTTLDQQVPAPYFEERSSWRAANVVRAANAREPQRLWLYGSSDADG